MIGNGWHTFAEEAELEVGDTLVLFKITSANYFNINACIFKAKEKVIDKGIQKHESSIDMFI